MEHGEIESLRMLGAWMRGETYAEIAQRYGVTKQAVHARLRGRVGEVHREANRRARVARRAREAEAARVAEERAAREAGQVCAIPGCEEVTTPSRRTCSPEHAAIWSVARIALDPKQHARHRRASALIRLTHPERYSESEVAHARAVLSDDPPPPNRRYRQIGSRVARVLEELGR